MKKQFGPEPFDFWPKGFSLDISSDLEEFKNLYRNRSETDPPLIYIIKRPAFVKSFSFRDLCA
jgi:hypothetical protein